MELTAEKYAKDILVAMELARGIGEPEENIIATALKLYAESEVKKFSSNSMLSDSLPMAVEYGFKSSEKGNNLEYTLIEFRKVIGNVR